jgi:leucyl-tRNA synthetase
VNDLYKLKTQAFGQHDVWHEALAALAACVSPFAPHIGEELWHQLGHSTSVHRDTWPKYDEQYLATDTVTVAVQVNGKLRGTIAAPTGSDEAAAVELTQADAKIAGNLAGKQIVKTIYVPGKLLNFVVK